MEQQFLDAIGTLHAAGEQLGAQLGKSQANLIAAGWPQGLARDLTKELAALVDADQASLASAKGGWKEHGLQVPASVSGIGPSELGGLLLAASEEGKAQDPGKPTVQRVLGRLGVQTAEWKDTEGGIRAGWADHGYLKSVPAAAAEAAALQHHMLCLNAATAIGGVYFCLFAFLQCQQQRRGATTHSLY